MHLVVVAILGGWKAAGASRHARAAHLAAALMYSATQFFLPNKSPNQCCSGLHAPTAGLHCWAPSQRKQGSQAVALLDAMTHAARLNPFRTRSEWQPPVAHTSPCQTRASCPPACGASQCTDASLIKLPQHLPPRTDATLPLHWPARHMYHEHAAPLAAHSPRAAMHAPGSPPPHHPPCFCPHASLPQISAPVRSQAYNPAGVPPCSDQPH